MYVEKAGFADHCQVIIEKQVLDDDDTMTFDGVCQRNWCTGNADGIDRNTALLNRANTNPDGFWLGWVLCETIVWQPVIYCIGALFEGSDFDG